MSTEGGSAGFPGEGVAAGESGTVEGLEPAVGASLGTDAPLDGALSVVTPLAGGAIAGASLVGGAVADASLVGGVVAGASLVGAPLAGVPLDAPLGSGTVEPPLVPVAEGLGVSIGCVTVAEGAGVGTPLLVEGVGPVGTVSAEEPLAGRPLEG